jgi:MFS family permease
MRPDLIASSTGVRSDKISPYLWILFSVCFIGNILGGTVSTIMSVYLPVVLRDIIGQVDEEQLNNAGAYINALYFAGWAIGGLTWGFVSDRIGRSRSLAMSIGMFGFFTIMTSLSSEWSAVMLWRFFSGFGVGGMLVINTTLLSEEWPESTRAIFIGILSIGFPVGIFSSGAINYIFSDWRQGFLLGIIPIITGFIAFWLLNESEIWKETSVNRMKNKISVNNGKYRKDLLFGSVIFGCMLIGLWAIFSWMPSWVQSILAGSDGQHERGLSMMMLGIGGLTGGFLSGWISNALGTRKAMLLCFAGCFLFSFLLFKGNSEFTLITLSEIALLSLMFGISQGLLSYYIPMLFPVQIRASATGFCFNTGRFFTAAAVFFVGTLVTTLGGFGNSLFTFSFVFLLGFIFLLFSKNITT